MVDAKIVSLPVKRKKSVRRLPDDGTRVVEFPLGFYDRLYRHWDAMDIPFLLPAGPDADDAK